MPTSFTAATVRPLAPSAVANQTNGARRPLGAAASGSGGWPSGSLGIATGGPAGLAGAAGAEAAGAGVAGRGGAGAGAGGPPQPASRPIRPSAAIHADLIARLPARAGRAAV